MRSATQQPAKLLLAQLRRKLLVAPCTLAANKHLCYHAVGAIDQLLVPEFLAVAPLYIGLALVIGKLLWVNQNQVGGIANINAATVDAEYVGGVAVISSALLFSLLSDCSIYD